MGLVTGTSAQADERGNSGVFNAEDVGQRNFGRTLNLEDPTGRMRSLSEFRGKVVLLYFGFIQCPDVCPTELARLAELRRRLGPAAGKVQVLFVTLDPERDTADVLREYAPAFDPDFIGLRGNPAATASAVREFRVVYQKIPGRTADRYTIDHSTYVYAIDPASRLRLRFNLDLSIERMLDDVNALLGGR
jgi:protein SCO1/2